MEWMETEWFVTQTTSTKLWAEQLETKSGDCKYVFKQGTWKQKPTNKHK